MRTLLAAAAIFAIYLFLTCLIEGCVIGLVFRNRRYVKYSVACNFITNPLLNFYLYLVAFAREYFLLEPPDISWKVLFVCGEMAVVFVETWLYYYILQRKPVNCFFMSLIANVCSAGCGLFLLRYEHLWISMLTKIF